MNIEHILSDSVGLVIFIKSQTHNHNSNIISKYLKIILIIKF